MSSKVYGAKVWVAGHKGMVGSALVRKLQEFQCDVITADRKDLDLLRQQDVERFISATRPDTIIVAAAKVGGILANSEYPVQFIHENLQISSNIIGSAHKYDVDNIVYLGSSCIYPKRAPQPIKESSLLTGPLEPTNEWYAIAKIAGLKLCEAYQKQYGRNYISVMPCNLYGPGDNYDLNSSHVIPALIRKTHSAKISGDASFSVWGTGTPLREFLHVEDCVEGIIHALHYYDGQSHLNIGSGHEITIRDLATTVAKVINFEGYISFDASKPDGTPRKLMDSSVLLSLGWAPRIGLEEGLSQSYDLFKELY